MEAFPDHFMKGDSPWRFDLAEKKMICRANAHEIYGRDVYCVAKRQLSRRELRKLGMFNQPERNPQQIPCGLLRIALQVIRGLGQASDLGWDFQLLAGSIPEYTGDNYEQTNARGGTKNR